MIDSVGDDGAGPTKIPASQALRDPRPEVRREAIAQIFLGEIVLLRKVVL